MFCQAPFAPWRSPIMTHVPPRRKSQARGLALWSLGMVLARSCALSAVSALMAEGLRQPENPGRQRLREWSPAAVRFRAPGSDGKRDKKGLALRGAAAAAAAPPCGAARFDRARAGGSGLGCPGGGSAHGARRGASGCAPQHRRDVAARARASVAAAPQVRPRGRPGVARAWPAAGRPAIGPLGAGRQSPGVAPDRAVT
jgi:hypothetical protein